MVTLLPIAAPLAFSFVGKKLLVIFNTVALYGMERTVIETFDGLRPHIEPHFLMSYTTYRRGLPVLSEIEQRGLSHSFFSDWTDWPRIGWPRSLRHFWQILWALVRGNLDTLRLVRDYEIIYLPGYRYLHLALLAVLWHRLRGKRVIYRFHDLLDKYSFSLRFASWLVTDFVHSTNISYQLIIKRNPYVIRKTNYIVPIPIGASVVPQTSEPEIAAACAGKKNILFVGQMERYKGIELLVEAFRLLAQTESDVVLHLVGTSSNPAWEEELRASVFARGCAIKLWGYRRDVVSFLKATDIYVQPSLPSLVQESFGRGAVEAMKASRPTVCLRSGALQEIVVHAQTGLIVEEETPSCLADSLLRLLKDPELSRKMGQAARLRYEEKYSKEWVKRGWLNLLEEGYRDEVFTPRL